MKKTNLDLNNEISNFKMCFSVFLPIIGMLMLSGLFSLTLLFEKSVAPSQAIWIVIIALICLSFGFEFKPQQTAMIKVEIPNKQIRDQGDS